MDLVCGCSLSLDDGLVLVFFGGWEPDLDKISNEKLLFLSFSHNPDLHITDQRSLHGHPVYKQWGVQSLSDVQCGQSVYTECPVNI